MPSRKTVNYELMWNRIRENPDKLVPIDISEPFVKRILRGLGQVKWLDRRHTRNLEQENKVAILYHNRVPHPTKPNIIRVTFCLRIFSNVNGTDTYYLRSHQPPIDLAKTLALDPVSASELGISDHD